MIICLPKIESSTRIGGGFSFLDNFKAGGHRSRSFATTECITGGDWNYALIPAATMCSWEQFQIMTAMRETNRPPKGKKVFLRVDGIPEDFRNRGTGWSRLKGFAKNVDGVIYQSEFSRDTVGKLLGRDGPVIYNGVDKTIFTPAGSTFPLFGDPSILCINYRDDPNKRVQEVIERFRYYKIKTPTAKITFVGNYPKGQFLWDGAHWDFGLLDLVQNEDWQYMGIISDRNVLAKAMRSCNYIAYPSFADSCPNALVESFSCGCKPLWLNSYGSSIELLELFNKGFDFSIERMSKEYLDYFLSVK